MAGLQASDTQTIYQGGGIVYYADPTGAMSSIGLLHEDGIEVVIKEEKKGVGSSLTGSGAVAVFTSGSGAEIKMKLRNFDKHKLIQIWQATVGNNTSPTDGTAGELTFGRAAGYRYKGRRLVVYPFWTTPDNTQYMDNDDNPFALEIYMAVCMTDLSFLMKPDTPSEIDLTFEVILDVTKKAGNYVGRMNTGIIAVGEVTGIQVTAVGSGGSNNATLTITATGGGGTGFAGTIKTDSTGKLDPNSWVITNGGSGYTSRPTLSLASPGSLTGHALNAILT